MNLATARQHLVLASLLLVMASCGGGGASDATGPGPGNTGGNNNNNTAATSVSVTISGAAFSPQQVTVKQGGTVTWTNNDDIDHTATGNGFDTGTLSKGLSSTKTFNATGTFSYFCSIHPGMTGSIVVVQ